jgi:hypothetical protein
MLTLKIPPNFVDENIENFTGPQKAKFQNFKDKFKIIKSGFRYKNDREKAEAFLIIVNKPYLNSHNVFMVTRDHDPFNLNLGPLIIYECSIYKVINQLFK